ncbi:MAG: ABC transporter permease subunit [Oligoflexus sp.]
MFRPVLALMRKEAKDALRDRRTLLSVLFIVLGFPLLYGGIIGLTEKRLDKEADRPIKLATQACENLPELCHFLQWNGIKFEELKSDFETDLLQGDIDAYLDIPKDSLERLNHGKKLNLTIQYHQSHDRSNRSAKRLEGLLMQYQVSMSSRRLITLGVSPELLDGFSIHKKSIRQGKMREYLMGTLYISILMMIAFLTTLQYANDSIAGEKDRGTLELLLNMAVSRSVILLGKWLILALIVCSGALAAALVFKWMGELPILQKIMGLYGSLSWQQILIGILLFAPIFFLAPLLQLFVSSISRSVREAQTYSSILMLSAFLPTAFLDNFAEKAWPGLLPFMGQALALRNFYRGGEFAWQQLLIAEALTCALIVVIFFVTVQVLRSESVLKTQ